MESLPFSFKFEYDLCEHNNDFVCVFVFGFYFFRVHFNRCGYPNKSTKIKEKDAWKESVLDSSAFNNKN